MIKKSLKLRMHSYEYVHKYVFVCIRILFPDGRYVHIHMYTHIFYKYIHTPTHVFNIHLNISPRFTYLEAQVKE